MVSYDISIKPIVVRCVGVLLSIGIITLLISCSDSGADPEPPNSDKKIQSFRLAISYPVEKTINGVIDNETGKITIHAGIDDRYEASTATVLVSPGATISPDPSLALNYESPVAFTVTAEDQTTTTYIVEVKRSKLAITSLNKQTLTPGETLTINGIALFSRIYNLWAVLKEGDEEFLLTSTSDIVYDTRLDLRIDDMMEIGTYNLELRYDGVDTVTWEQPLVIDFPDHTTMITKVKPDKTPAAGDPSLYSFSVFAVGRFLGNTSTADISNANLYLVNKSDATIKQLLTKKSYGSTSKNTYFSINAAIPNGTISADEYYLEIEFKGKSTLSDTVLSYPW